MAFVPITPEKIATAHRVANSFRRAAERRYASNYVAWLRNGATGPEPRSEGLSKATLVEIRSKIDAVQMWKG